MTDIEPKLPLSIRELLALKKFLMENAENRPGWTTAENNAINRVMEKVYRLAEGREVTPVSVDTAELEVDELDLAVLLGALILLDKRLLEMVGQANDALMMGVIGALADEREHVGNLKARVEIVKRELWRQTNHGGPSA